MANRRKGVTNLYVNLQAGTPRTVYATWTGTRHPNQDGYRVVWMYDTGQGVNFVGNDSTTAGTNSTYTAPNNAVAVTVSVTPKRNNKAKWTAPAATYTYSGPFKDEQGQTINTTPAAPSVQDPEVAGTVITARVAGYHDQYCSGVIRFQFVVDDSAVCHQVDSWIDPATDTAVAVYYAAQLGGHRYKVRAMALGNSGTDSAWGSYTSNKYTAPGKAEITNLVAMSKNSVDVRYKALNGATNYTIEYTSTTVDGVPVFDTGSSDVQSGTSSTTHFLASSLAYERWYFRVRGSNSGGDGEWDSKENYKSIQLGTQPDKPSVWCYTSVGKIGTPIILNWMHSSEDGSAQSGAKVGIKINNEEETEVELTTETSYTLNTSNLSDSDKIKWRVKTKGTEDIYDEHGTSIEWGEYSEYREIIVYAPPSIEFTVGYPDPEEAYPVIYQFPIHIEGASAPSTQTPVAFYISITANEQYDISGADGIEIHVSAGQEVYSNYIPTDIHTLDLTLTPGDIYLNRGTTYTVTATVAMTNGLTAEASQVVMAKWDIPSWEPDGEVTIDRDVLCAYIRPFCADKWNFEYKEGFTLAIYRIDFDGNLTEIASDISAGSGITVTDLHPSLDYARYRIVATDLKTGVVFYSDLGAIPVSISSAVLQWEGEFRSFYAEPNDVDNILNEWAGTILRLPYNVDVSDDISPDVSLIEYIGRKHPVSYYGTQQGSTSRWNVEVPKTDYETIAKIRSLAIYPGDVYVREPYGTGYWANVKVSYSISYNKASVPVTFTITRVEGGA